MLAKNVRGILVEYLKANGCDGLCGDDCGCGVEFLCPCSGWDIDISECMPARLNHETDEWEPMEVKDDV